MCLLWLFVIWFLEFCVHSYKIDKDFFILYDSGLSAESGESILTNLRKILPVSKKDVPRRGKVRDVEVDAVVLSHPDNDHYGGFEYLLKKDSIEAKHLYLNVNQFTQHLRQFLVFLRANDYRVIDRGHLSLNGEVGNERDLEEECDPFKVELVPGQVSLIYPRHGRGRNKNANSILLQVENPKILLSGDSTGGVIFKRVKVLDGKTFDTFHVPHHGSSGNSLAPFSAARVKIFTTNEFFLQSPNFATHKIYLQLEKAIAARILMVDVDLYILLSARPGDEIHAEQLEIQARLEDKPFPYFIDADWKFCEEITRVLERSRKVLHCIHKTMRIAAFYLRFPSRKYFISCGKSDDRYKHPRIEVMCGIVIAALVKMHKCTIVLNFARDLEKKLDLFDSVLPAFYPIRCIPTFRFSLLPFDPEGEPPFNLPSGARVLVPHEDRWMELVTIKTPIQTREWTYWNSRTCNFEYLP